MAQQIEEHLTDDKYNRILVLDVEGKDKDRFEQAEERRKNPPVIMPKLSEKKGKGRAKKKSMFLYYCNCIVWSVRYISFVYRYFKKLYNM